MSYPSTLYQARLNKRFTKSGRQCQWRFTQIGILRMYYLFRIDLKYLHILNFRNISKNQCENIYCEFINRWFKEDIHWNSLIVSVIVITNMDIQNMNQQYLYMPPVVVYQPRIDWYIDYRICNVKKLCLTHSAYMVCAQLI